MDSLDRAIIVKLSENARASFAGIAKKEKVSESTIRKRVASLEEKGIIKKYSLVLNHAKMGLENQAFIGVDAEPEQYLEVGKALKMMPEIRSAWSASGDHMFMVEVLAKDNDNLMLVSDKIRRIGGVTRICPAVVKETLKGEV